MATVTSASTSASTLVSTLESALSSTFSSASSLNISMAMRQSIQDVTQEIEFTISSEKQVTQAINESNRVQQVFNESVQTGATAIDGTNEAINESNRAQQRFNESAQTGKTAIDRISGAITLANEGIALMERVWSGVNKVMTLADDVTSTNSRIAMINDGTWNLLDLQKQVLKVANDTRASYTATADLLVKAGVGTQGVFKNTQNMLGFAERFNKLLAAGQANATDKSSATLQMSQALENGSLGSSELVAIENAVPMFANILAEGLGVSVEQIRQMGAEGELTADRIVNALENQEERINGLFLQTPGTFSEAMTVLGDKVSFWIGQLNKADGPLQQITKRIQELNVWLDTTEGMQFFNNLAYGVNIAINIILTLFGVLFQVVNFMSSNWSIIEPIVWGIVAAFTAWSLTNLWDMVKSLLATAKTGLLANWQLLLIGAAIGFILYAMIKWGDTTVRVIGFIGGLFGIFFAYLYNRFAKFANIVLSVAEFFINVWQDPIYAVKKLFYDLSINTLEFMINIAKGIENLVNKIPGIHIEVTSGVEGILDKLKSERDALKTEADVVNLMRFEQKDYGEAFDMGRNIGKQIGSAAVNSVQAAFDSLSNLSNPGDLGGTAGRGEEDILNINEVGSVGKINDTVDISSEDLKIMRELAEMKNIQNFVTMTPTVSVTTGDIRNGSDADTIVEKIKTMLESDIASSASAVYG